MATFKPVVLKGQINIKDETNVKILITHKRKTAYLKTDFYIKPNHMGSGGKVKYHPNAKYINRKLSIDIFDYQKKVLLLEDAADDMNVQEINEMLVNNKAILDCKKIKPD